ncbi:hypothetical protein UFOVP1360_21 [uncultured Caudovirales phage]|uniref:Uncharacterized protein n=1 Tax=uncultured Caudovirales phage TaxID=2100421 RepID=A0A6J5RYC6_9CAUD|nr:hypothetical protein UFOVP1360_21 [uncultured Caudovirales phage]
MADDITNEIIEGTRRTNARLRRQRGEAERNERKAIEECARLRALVASQAEELGARGRMIAELESERARRTMASFAPYVRPDASGPDYFMGRPWPHTGDITHDCADRIRKALGLSPRSDGDCVAQHVERIAGVLDEARRELDAAVADRAQLEARHERLREAIADAIVRDCMRGVRNRLTSIIAP